MDDIQQISSRKKWAKTLDGYFFSKFKDGETLVGILTVTGGFGSAEIKFKSLQKCNQAYANLAHHLEMGDPVIIR